jgi:hypothetical protein
MKRILLKKTKYNKLPETIFGIVVSLIFLGLVLSDILSGAENVSDDTIIVGVIFFVLLIFFLWRLVVGRPQVEYININGWEYRLFQKAGKWKFICISGLVSAVRQFIIITILYLSNLIKNEMSPVQVILIVIGLCAISFVPFGYMNYKNYASVDMDSDLTHPFYKKK